MNISVQFGDGCVWGHQQHPAYQIIDFKDSAFWRGGCLLVYWVVVLKICVFTPIWGRWTHFDSYFSDGLAQPPTSFVRMTRSTLPDIPIHRLFSATKNTWVLQHDPKTDGRCRENSGEEIPFPSKKSFQSWTWKEEKNQLTPKDVYQVKAPSNQPTLVF